MPDFKPDFKSDFKPEFMPDFKWDCLRDFQVTIDEDLINNFHRYIERNCKRYCKLDI